MRTIKEISAQKKVKYYINNVIKQKEKITRRLFWKYKNFWKKFFKKMTPEENRGVYRKYNIIFFKIQTWLSNFFIFTTDLDEQALPCISHILTSLNVSGVTC